MPTPKPTDIVLHKKSHTLEVAFDSGEHFVMPCEYLRVHSPSAEVQGHGPGQRVLVAGKREVNINAIEPVGNYAVLLRFSDGHATGIFSWETLYDLGINQDSNWKSYLDALEKNTLSREAKSPYGHPVPMRGPKPR
ncbi:MAG: gamma-butyrobetaine hydroxylase-like domain-containing protein [Rhodanobacteraceae bacterium]